MSAVKALAAQLSPKQTAASVKPLFAQEGPQNYAAATAHNAPFAKPGPEETSLAPFQEVQFQQWVKQNRIPFDVNAIQNDYDMRGYWAANPLASHAQGQHFPDTYKTKRDTTFSNQSMYAKPGTPFQWQGNNLIDTRTGQLISR